MTDARKHLREDFRIYWDARHQEAQETKKSQAGKMARFLFPAISLFESYNLPVCLPTLTN